MIRYSSYSRSNYRTKLTTLTDALCSLEKEYHELQALRERVRRAEAAAATRLPRSNGHRQNSD